MLGALAQGVGPTGVGMFANVDTGAILAILFLLAISVSSTAWQALAILAYFSPILAITVHPAHWLFWWGTKISKKVGPTFSMGQICQGQKKKQLSSPTIGSLNQIPLEIVGFVYHFQIYGLNMEKSMIYMEMGGGEG